MASTTPELDLIEYADGVKSEIPSYQLLRQKAYPDFLRFLSGVRERSRQKKAAGKHVFIVIGTGGTFQSKETFEGLTPEGTLEESLAALGLPEDPTVHLEKCNLMRLDSSQMTVDQWRFLADVIIDLEETAGDAYDAIIITHGTDTMAKAASYLSFMLRGFPKSIIFTGSQEPALKKGTDAKDNMERSVSTAKLSVDINRRVCEVMVCCGLDVARGTWAAKLGDKTVNAFGPWNQPHQAHDANDWHQAAQNEEKLARLAPALLSYGTGKSKGSLEFAPHAISFEKRGGFDPFTDIRHPADIYPVSLSDKSPLAFARHITNQEVAVLTALGSATADDRLVKIALAAARSGKAIIFQAPFPDSSVSVGTYKAGKGMKEHLPNIHGPLPFICTSPDAFGAKINYVKHKSKLKPQRTTEGLGPIYSDKDLRIFYDLMNANLVRELVVM